MLPAPVSSRPVGLPTNPRPQRAPNSTRNSPYTPPSDFPSVSTARTRPAHPTSGPSPLHARSRSQPPRTRSSPKHDRSTSTITRAYEESDLRSSASRDRGQARTRSPLPVSSTDRTGPGPSQDSQRRRPSPALLSPEGRTPSETPYVRPTTRKATIDESSGDGYAIWNAVSNVASALTISVSKAWSANIATFSGEETPPGQESRLTRAMKAYHIAQARSPSDLPDWLFDDRERRAVIVSPEPDEIRENGTQVSRPPQNNTKQDFAIGERLISTSVISESTSAQSQLRGADRLKAMREAKRRIGERGTSEFSGSDERQANLSLNAPQPATRQPRIGLPSGPRRGR
ncbi:hypothetical protein D9756_001608 [Leucocoprinus leucothites]|uniref:Uncharacterized protein n=1 Tax=Leucocoprinus leucothites TaxID=201217 RepID=A0A8H5G4J1_9AGAR|nr:hypothetical protein D9756_001608 [Leucoagaricus leucothites]